MVVMVLFQHFMNIIMQSAPWLLFGFFLAGVVKAMIPMAFLHRHLGNSDQLAVIKGAVFGAPLPLCSCGVIPAALGIRRAGASKAATTSFLIATPETGVDSVSITYALLGPFMAIVRPIAALTTAIAAGFAVLLFEKSSRKKPAKNSGGSCCQAKKTGEEIEKSSAQSTEVSSCCAKKESLAHPIWGDKLYAGLKFTFIDLVKDTSLWLLIGFFMAALIMTVLPPSFLTQWGSSSYAYLVMAMIGVPMYICATASTPIAAGFLFAGVSPGAVLVFLLVGPATNIATLAIVRNELGGRILAIYLTTIVVMGFVFGWITDYFSDFFTITIVSNHVHNHHLTTPLQVICALVLITLIANGLRIKYQWGKKTI